MRPEKTSYQPVNWRDLPNQGFLEFLRDFSLSPCELQLKALRHDEQVRQLEAKSKIQQALYPNDSSIEELRFLDDVIFRVHQSGILEKPSLDPLLLADAILAIASRKRITDKLGLPYDTPEETINNEIDAIQAKALDINPYPPFNNSHAQD